MTLFRERRQLVICVLAAVMIGGFILFRYLPVRKRMKGIKSLRTQTQRAVVKASNHARELPALREQLKETQRKVENYAENIPTQRDLGLFLHQIAALMNEHGLEEQMVQPGKETQAEGLNCILVNMQCRGGLEQIFEFYRSLRKLDRLIRIEHVKLVNKTDFSGQVTMQTKAVIYYRGQTEQG